MKIHIWLEAFAATKCNKIFSDHQPRQNGTIDQGVRGVLCLHQGVKMEAEGASETLSHSFILTRLVAREDFIEL
jgi:hypothetical protein